MQELQEEQDDEEDEYLATQFTRQQIIEQKALMHQCIDKHLAEADQKQSWEQLIASHSTDDYIANLADAIEGGVAEFAKLGTKEKGQLQGRAKINVRRVKHSYTNTQIREGFCTSTGGSFL